MLNKIKSSFQGHRYFWIFLFFYLIFRVLIINTNSAEWGDSYRILRATEFLQNYTYPEDEKRPPLFSFVLLAKFHEDPVTSGRVSMLIISIVNLILFYYLVSKIIYSIEIKSNIYRFIPLISTILFGVSPLFLYWSLRIYADNLFLTFLLLSFNIFFLLIKSSKEIHKFLYVLALSLVTLLSILTRFEGYLIYASISLALFSFFVLKKDRMLRVFLIYTIFIFGLILLVSRYEKFTFYQNPLISSYVDEVESRKLTLKEVSNYFFQLLFLSGSIVGFIFLVLGVKSFLKRDFLPIYIFILMQLGLSFIWFAAVPRLFLPVLPFYILLMVLGVLKFCENVLGDKNRLFLKKFTLLYIALLFTYVISQYFLKVPFLITGFRMLAINIFVGVIGIFFVMLLIYKFKTVTVKVLGIIVFAYIFISSLIWSYLFISLEKDTYKVLNQAVVYFIKNYPSNVVVMTNDVSSITRFYFKDRYRYSRELDLNRDIEEKIQKVSPDFIIVTNEHNPQMSFTPSKIPNLILEKEFKEVVNSRSFFTQIIRVNSE